MIFLVLNAFERLPMSSKSYRKLELSKLCFHPYLSLKVFGGILDILVPDDVYHVVLQHVIFAIEEAYVILIVGRWARQCKPLIT